MVPKARIRRLPPPDERTQMVREAAQATQREAALLSPADLQWLVQHFAKADTPPQRADLRRMAKVTLDLEAPATRPVWLVRPVGLDFPALRAIVQSDPVLKAIIWTRIAQVQRFLRPSNQEWKPGFRLRFKDRNKIPDDADQARLFWLEQFILNCGAEFDPRRRRQLRRDDLWDWAAKHLQDSLSLDAAPIELVATPSGRTHGWVHVDGGMVYLVDPSTGLEGRDDLPDLEIRYNLHLPDPEEVTAVLADEGQVKAWYTHNDLIYRVRRPSSNLDMMGYGQPEPEDLIKIVIGFLNALTLNLRGFTHNSIPRGILALFGDFQQEDIANLKSEWDAQVAGLSNRWRIPLLIGESAQPSGANWIPIDSGFNEMYFSRWMTFLVAIKCALYGMDPEEVNFEAFTSRNASLSGSDTEERLASSKDKGLWPLLQFLGKTLNEILYTVDPEVELYWTGLEQDQQLAKQDESTMLTWGEYRQRRGESVPEDRIMADAPMNPALMGLYQGQLQIKQQAEMQQQQAQMQQQQAQPAADQPWPETTQEGHRVMADGEGGAWKVEPGFGQENLAKAHQAELSEGEL